MIQGLAQLASSQIVNCLVFGLALAAVAGAVSALVLRQNSASRFALWFSALLAIASLFLIGRPLSSGAARAHAPEISLPAQWAVYVFLAWAAIALIGLMRVARGLWRVHALRKSCTPVNSTVLAESQIAAPQHARRRFTLVTSQLVRVPAAIGFFRPMIVLPAWTLNELSADELRAVVLHEAAHLERWDDWTNLVQKVIRALLFFHPAVWWIDNRLSMEREISCDDRVLAESQDARKYAGCLISLAEKTSAHRSLALAQAAVSRVKHMAHRISKILDGRQRKTGTVLKPALATMAAFGAIGFVGVRHTPELVGFTKGNANTTASRSNFDYVMPSENTAPRGAQRAHAVNAKFTAPRNQSLIAAHRTAQRNIARPNSEHVRAPRPVANEGRVINASATDVSFVYFVTRTEQYDSFGNVVVTTTVWRIPVRSSMQGGILPHST